MLTILILIVNFSFSSSIILDTNNLYALNVDVRTALLYRIKDALESTFTQLENRKYEFHSCKSQLEGLFSGCASCIEGKCRQTFANCYDRKPVTQCSLMSGDKMVCQAIFDIESPVLEVIEDISSNIRRVMRRFVSEQGKEVLKLLTELKQLLGRFHSPRTPRVKSDLDAVISYYKTVKISIDGGIHHNAMMQANVRGMQNMMRKSVAQMGSRMSGRTGAFMSELTLHLGNILGSTMGRKKRQVASCTEVEDFSQHCKTYYSPGCPCENAHGTVRGSTACGDYVYNKVNNMMKHLKAAVEIFEKIAVQEDFIKGVDYGNRMVNMRFLGFQINKYNAQVRTIGKEFQPSFNLEIFDLPRTAGDMAAQIWRAWENEISAV